MKYNSFLHDDVWYESTKQHLNSFNNFDLVLYFKHPFGALCCLVDCWVGWIVKVIIWSHGLTICNDS